MWKTFNFQQKFCLKIHFYTCTRVEFFCAFQRNKMRFGQRFDVRRNVPLVNLKVAIEGQAIGCSWMLSLMIEDPESTGSPQVHRKTPILPEDSISPEVSSTREASNLPEDQDFTRRFDFTGSPESTGRPPSLPENSIPLEVPESTGSPRIHRKTPNLPEDSIPPEDIDSTGSPESTRNA